MVEQNWEEGYSPNCIYFHEFHQKLSLIKNSGPPYNYNDFQSADLIHPGLHQGVDYFFQTYPLPPQSYILQIGSGLGGTARHLAVSKSFKIYGFDLMAHHIQAATQANKLFNLEQQIEFQQGDLQNIELGQQKFDAAIVIGTFMYTSSYAGYYSVSKALKRGSLFYFQEYYFKKEREEFTQEQQRCFEGRGMIGTKSLQEYKKVFQDAGFDILEIQDIGKRYSQAVWQRAEKMLGEWNLHQDNYFHYVEQSPVISCELRHLSFQEIQERYPKVCEFHDAQQLVFNSQQFAGVVGIVARKR